MKKEKETAEIIEPDKDEASIPTNETEVKGFRINMHIVLLSIIAIIFVLIVIRVMTWGNFISQEEIFSDGPGTYEFSLDMFVPLLDEEGNMVPIDYSDGLNIVAFGNAPFADDRDSEDNLANLIAQRTGATVYNCSISDSYLAVENLPFDAETRPMDLFCFYWLSINSAGRDTNFYLRNAAITLGENAPSEAAEVIETLSSLDFNTVDVIVIMYDATDYLLGRPVYNGAYNMDPMCFTGNLTAGIEVFQEAFPHIRIIVMSPTYAFAVDENGDYISSDVQRYGQEVLSTYSMLEFNVCTEMNVTYVDNLYGTINEDNAMEYLTDNLHLNLAGRNLVADRFQQALFYFGY